MTESTMAATPDTGVDVATQEQTREPERFVTPAVDIYEKEAGLVVVADLPGIEREQLDIAVENDILTIKATVRETMEQDVSYREFTHASYFRQFRLGNRIDRAKIDAELKHGVLRLTLPFAEETKPRSIEVKVA